MEMTGEYRIAASRAQVWAALNDPEVLKISIPGCETLEMTSDSEMTAKVVAKIGPVKASFTGRVRLENINPPESYTIAGEGQGGVAGFAKGGADVKLTEDGGETVLAYTVRAQIGGKLAQLGSRLIDSTSKMMADQFFAKFSAIVTERALIEAGGGAAAEPATVAEAATAAASGEPAPVVADAAIRSTGASAAPISVGSGLPGWVIPLVTLVVGVIIGKYLLH
jgi:carbon monoxide dehydrogenase subunit G